MSTQVNNPASLTPAWGMLPRGNRPLRTVAPAWQGGDTVPPAGAAIPLLPLPYIEPSSRRSPSHTSFVFPPMWTWPLPIRPSSGLQCAPTMPAIKPAEAAVRPAETAEPEVKPVEALRQFWNTAPVDLRWLAVSLPLILMLVVYSTTRSAAKQALPPVAKPASVQQSDAPAPEAAVVPASSGGSLLQRMQRLLASRAAVHLLDDFRGGLGSWSGRAGWSHTWSYDNAGFVRVGSLSLYKPTLPLRDYHMEFLAQIETRSLGWVYRAQDLDNYYATKIVLSNRGPQPVGTIVRYAVVHGRETGRTELPLPLNIQKDTVYRVQVDVEGNSFTTVVQGQVVDYWSDNRLTHGGVGFFSSKGEQSRLRWVELSHQADTLGRLCAALSPMGTSEQNGSSK